jgi:hypothetical protein
LCNIPHSSATSLWPSFPLAAFCKSFQSIYIYSAYNHKRTTAAKCRESHHRRTDATPPRGCCAQQ